MQMHTIDTSSLYEGPIVLTLEKPLIGYDKKLCAQFWENSTSAKEL